MSQHDDEATGSAVEAHAPREVSIGTAIAPTDAVENPGMPPHRERVTDLDPRKDRQMSRRVVALFLFSILASAFAIFAYFFWPIDVSVEGFGTIRQNNMFIGIGLAFALLAIGTGIVLWGKNLMSGEEFIQERHDTRGTPEVRATAIKVFEDANNESGFGRRKLIRNTLFGAIVAMPLPAIFLFRDLAPAAEPHELLRHTMWEQGVRLVRDPDGTPIRAADVTIGSAFHVIPANLEEAEHVLDAKAKAVVLLMRLNPADLNEREDRKDWSYDGIVAYSKICTHVGCPVALYEQHTHHLLCPCHQSQFDVANHARVIFGPAARPLPQLPIEVDGEGYLVAKSDFTEPVGPSFWERER